jgi:hypothetical protein
MEGRGKKEEGSSATDYVTDVTDGRKREEGRRKFGNGLCNGCNGCQGRRKEGRRKKEEGKLFPLPTLNSKFKIKT